MNQNLPFRENIPLKEHCTLGIGGPARYFMEVSSVKEMQEAIILCKKHKLRFMVLGKGSNCLFDDRGVNGVVLHNKIDFCEQIKPGVFHAGAGYSFSLLGVQTARQGWSGLEFASGIPASVGGAVFMNAGANGAETCRHLDSVDYVDEHGELHQLQYNQLSFSYRYSSFQDKKGSIVGATFILKHNPEARQKQIEIVNIRSKTQPYGSKSAGCVFLNTACESAGALIDRCGLKGLSVGGAQVSTLHANFLVNANQASCRDMLDLIDLVKQQVHEKTEITLENEVRCVEYHKEEL